MARGPGRDAGTNGFRNPWRFSFDAATGKFWVADVGESAQEEIDMVEAGKDYGWSRVEGTACFGTATCDQSGTAAPVYTYGRDGGQCITGGYVYHGPRFPGLANAYVFAAFASGRVWQMAPDRRVTQLVATSNRFATVGLDGHGELALVDYATGKVYRFR